MRSSRRILRCLVLMFVAASGSSSVVPARAAQVLAATHPGAETSAHPWSGPAQELARKTSTRVDARAAILLTVRNMSSLGADEAAEVRRALRTELRREDLQLVSSPRAGGKRREPDHVLVTLSENSQGYLWVAEIVRATEQNAALDVTMVEVARAKEAQPARSPVSLVIRKLLVWEQDEPILDAAAIDIPVPCHATAGSGQDSVAGDATQNIAKPSATATQANTPGAPVLSAQGSVQSASPCLTSGLLVLEPSKLSLHVPQKAGAPSTPAHTTGGTPSSPEPSAPLPHSKPWPRDLRGRLLVWPDRSLRSVQGWLFDAYLPGVKCHGAVEPAVSIDCQDLDEPWPLGAQPKATGEAVLRAAYAAGRNFFDGRLVLTNGEERQAPAFFSGAALPANGSVLWILAGVDGRARVFSNTYQAIETFGGWGSDVVSVKSGCGSDWLVLADAATDSTEPDSVRAYGIGRREAIAVSPSVEFPGPVTALWPAAGGGSAVAVSRNFETGRYEAYSLSVSCSQ